MIPFTQFMMPDGRREAVTIERTPEIELMAHRIIAAGYAFEIEMLSDYKSISMEIINKRERVLAADICENGPQVPPMIDRLVTEAFAKIPHRFQIMTVTITAPKPIAAYSLEEF